MVRKKINIVMGKDAFYPFLRGGGEVHTFQVAKEFAKAGNRVIVLCGKTSQFPSDSFSEISKLRDRELVEGVNIYRMKKAYHFGATFESLPALREMSKVLKTLSNKGCIDVANFDIYRPVFPFKFGLKNDIPKVCSMRVLSSAEGGWKGWKDYDASIFSKFSQKVIEDIVIKLKYDAIFADSKVVKKEILKRNEKANVKVVLNGVDTTKFDRVVHEDSNVVDNVVFLGNLKKRKNIPDAIKAAHIVRKKRNIKFHIISDGGELENQVITECNKHKWIIYHKKAIFTEKVRILKSARVLLFPSLKEGLPLVPIEAVYCKTPYVAYNIPPMIEEHSLLKGGCIVKIGDYIAMAKKAIDILENEKFYNDLCYKGHIQIKKYFTWDIIAKKELEHYHNCIKKKVGN